MKAILKKTDGVYLEEVSKPEIGVGEVLVKVAYAGLCRTDCYVAKNQINTATPLILGHEFSGIVESGDGFEGGEKVAIMPIMQDEDGYFSGGMLGLDMDGAFAEFVKVPSSMVYRLPENMDLKIGALLEPVAASCAVLGAPIQTNMKGIIQGQGRIAKLTQDIMAYKGLQADILSDLELAKKADNSYDYIVETFVNDNNIDDIIRTLKPGGILVLKSRSYFPVNIKIAELVKKDISIYAKYYGDIQESIELLANLDLDILLGDEYDFSAFTDIINSPDYDESKKLFLKVN